MCLYKERRSANLSSGFSSSFLIKAVKNNEGGETMEDASIDKTAVLKKFLPRIKRLASRKSWGDQMLKDDLMSAGVEGLLGAIDRYDSSKGTLETYAFWRINGAMNDELLSWNPLSRRYQENQKRVKKAVDEITKNEGRAPTCEEIARHLGVTLDEYLFRFEKHNDFKLVSINNEGEGVVDECSVTGESIDPEKSVYIKQMREIVSFEMEKISKEHKNVLLLYYYGEKTLKEIGERLNLTESRASQLHTEAIEILRERVEKRGTDDYGKIIMKKIRPQQKRNPLKNVTLEEVVSVTKEGTKKREILLLSYGLIDGKAMSAEKISKKVRTHIDFVYKSLREGHDRIEVLRKKDSE